MVFFGFEGLLQPIAADMPEWLVELIASATVFEHFNTIAQGNFRFLDLVWFLSIIVGCLFGTNIILSAKRA